MPIDVQFPGNLGQVDTIAKLRQVPTSGVDAETIYIAMDVGRTYSFDFGSLLNDDGINVIRPNDRMPLQAGRFIYLVDGFAPGNPGAPGPAGPADNTYTTLAALLASDPARKSARLVPQVGETAPAGNFNYINGAWVRQEAEGIVTRSLRPAAVPTDPQEVQNRRIDVMDFVSKSDRAIVQNGSGTDIAYAINAAMQAAAPYNVDVTNNRLFATVHAPNLPFAVRSPVFVRRGVSLRGGGYGAVVDCIGATANSFTNALFNLGMKDDGTTDPGGAPSEMVDFRTFSAIGGGSLIKIHQPGARLHNIFATSVDDGIVIEDSSDVIISDVTIDQGSVALRFKSSAGMSGAGAANSGNRNIVVNNLICYTMAHAVISDGDFYDTVFNNMLICYPRVHGFFFSEGSFRHRNIRINGGALIVNAQGEAGGQDYGTFAGAIRSRGNDVQIHVSNFSFRNYKGAAIVRDNGIGFEATFDNCEFNGQSTDRVNYNTPSTTSKVYVSGTSDRVTFNNCKMANLAAQPIELTGSSRIDVIIENSDTFGNAAPSLILQGNTSADSRIVIGDNKGDGTQTLLSGTGTAPIYVRANSNVGFTDSATVASASTISVPKVSDVIAVTGTTGVTNITPDKANAGRRVTFILGGSQTWTDGGNINLQGDFPGTQDDSITLATGDGLSWYEVGRSPN